MPVTELRPTTERLPRRDEIRIRVVPPRRVIEVKGTGAPGTPAFQAAISALYGVAYGVHFALRKRDVEARVGALEGLWTFDRDPFRPPESVDEADSDLTPDPSTWRWTLLIELPTAATEADVAAAIEAARRTRPSPALDELRAVWLDEGEVVEALHVGPYATEPETVARMAAVTREAGCTPIGLHHEIYLGDPRRTAPDRLRTLLRQPIGHARSSGR